MQLLEFDDRRLVSAYIQGKEPALEVLINRHKEKVFTYILSIVKNRQQAEDVFQDLFVKVIHTLKGGGYNEEGKFLPWVMRIAHNMSIDTFRRAKRMPMVDGGEDFDIFDAISNGEMNAEDQIVWNQICGDAARLIDELPDDQSEVLKMRLYQQMSFKEIAEDTGVSINTALGRMRYALINLRKLIEEKNLILTKF